jgi:hypothetical protein
LGSTAKSWRYVYAMSGVYLKEQDGGVDQVLLKAPNAVTTAYTFTLPPDAGTNNYLLKTDGSGTTTWVSAGTILSAATPALDNLASVAINTSLLPASDNAINLGSSSKAIATVYAASIEAGRSGIAGAVDIYPATASKGHIAIECAANTTDHILHITNAALNGTSRTWTIPNISANGTFAALEGSQTFSGTKTFSSQIISSATSSHLKLATSSSNAIISVATIATADRTVTIPDPGTNANFVLSEATATINGTKTFAGQLIGKGTATNDDAAAGYIGEYISGSVTSDTNLPTSGQFGNSASIALTAGDWDISWMIVAESQTGTWSSVSGGIGTVTGNDATGLTRGSTLVLESFANSATARTQISLSIPRFRVSLSGSVTYYLKVSATYTAGQPQYRGVIAARRIR